ncbi:MAG: hypothetical protein AAFY53_05150, partial [Pseudomonadota bacterium]
LLLLLAVFVFRMVWRMFDARQKTNILKETFANWRLALLGATGVVLSLASGWTTWDGMRNFTQEPLLSLMITFGIQGVMLIVAWLIGESFATGMNARSEQTTGDGRHRATMANAPSFRLPHWLPQAAGLTIGALVFGALALLILDAFDVTSTDATVANSLVGLSNNLLIAAVLLAVVGAILMTAGGQVFGDYAQALRIMARTAVLWVMFLACMGTSVFFSFDSLFSQIFPQAERKRAAELRAQNQIAGVVSDIGAISTRRRLTETEALFQSEGWRAYDGQLDRVIEVASSAPDAIRRQIASELETQRSRIAELEEKRASAQSGQASLEARKTRITEELARVKTARPESAARVDEFRGVVAEIEKRADEARAAMLAEERGVEGSGKVGRGRMWRAARATLVKIQAELEVANRRLKGHRDRLDTIDRKSSSLASELAQIDGELAKLKGAAQTAQQLIGVAETNTTTREAQQLDPAASVGALEKARQSFRQNPTSDKLATIQGLCLNLQNAGLRVESLARGAGTIDCDPGTASESAARVFALNVGIKALQANCVGGDKLPTSGGADALFAFARSCVQDSGLPSDATGQLRQRINSIELNRDDKAHRFVVTTNAFNDGNTLAYLALAIAIAIDSLVFMSGLFGANALQTPLGRIGSGRSLSAGEMVKVIEAALQPDKYAAATTALRHIHPMRRDRQVHEHNDWTHEVAFARVTPADTAAVLAVVNAAQTIDAAKYDALDTGRVLLRRQLVQHLNLVASNAFEKGHIATKQGELTSILTTVLQPHVHESASQVIMNLRPVSTETDFSNEIVLDDIELPFAKEASVRALNAGSTLNTPEMLIVAEDKNRGSAYLTHSIFFKTLAAIAADHHRVSTSAAYGGAIHSMDGIETSQRVPLSQRITHGATPASPDAETIADAPAGNAFGASPRNAAAASAVASAPVVDRSPEPEPSEDLEERSLRQYLASIGVAEDAYNWALDHIGDLAATEQSFIQILGRNEHLSQRIREIQEDAFNALYRVHNGLAEQHADQPGVGNMLTEQRKAVEEILPLLLMAPNGRYLAVVDTVITDLELAENNTPDGLRNDEIDQLRRLKAHRAEIGSVGTISETLASLDGYLQPGNAAAQGQTDNEPNDNVELLFREQQRRI